tara:strand:+ start:378 stop:611 length:234 start_codon:yes stop_codon:yes gene_type:complete
MNKARRKKLDEIQSEITDLVGRLEEVLDDEQEARESVPENLEYTERTELMDEHLDAMQAQKDALEEAQSELEEIANS